VEVAMRYWEFFWTACLLVAGSSFVFITIVVIIKGARDLKDMFAGLLAHRDED
jgi:hypothetical protein